MLIDRWDPVYSSARVLLKVGGGNSPDDIATARFINRWRDAVAACGWTSTGTLKASGTIHFTLGLPTAPPLAPGEPPSTNPTGCPTIGATLKLEGRTYFAYDPNRDQPSNCGSGTVWFEAGTSWTETAGNLAAKITAASSYNASASGTDITLIAKNPGPDYNFPVCIPNPRHGGPGVINGGGWAMVSTGAGATQLTVAMTGIGGNGDGGDGSVQTVVTTLSGGSSTWVTGVHPVLPGYPLVQGLRILANAHGFCFFDPKDDQHFLVNTSLLVQAIQIPPEFYDCGGKAHFVAGPGSFRNTTGPWARQCAVGLDGGHAIWSNGACPRLIMARALGPHVLESTAGVPLVQGAYIAMGNSPSSQIGVVGRMWDCVIIGDYMPGGLELPNPDDPNKPYKFEAVAAQDGANGGTRSTLLWRYE